MYFLKCSFCNNNSVKIFSICTFSGVAKSQCIKCGLSSPAKVKNKVKVPEVIYK